MNNGEATVRQDPNDQPLPSLLQGIATDLESLVRQELSLTAQLFRQELAEFKTTTARVLSAGILLLVATLMLAIGGAATVIQLLAWPAWAAFFAVAALLGGLGTILIMTGRKREEGDARDH